MLEVQSIRVGYGDLTIVDNFSLHVDRGEVVALIGANGAGKTTIQRAICGLEPVRAGRVLFEGRDLAGWPTYKVVTLGLVMVPANARVFGKFSVKDNLLMGALASRPGGRGLNDKLREIYELFPVLADRSGQRAETLSGGERQMLAMGRALMSEPTLLMMDEPTAGLAPKLAAEVLTFVDRMRALGLTCLVVEEKVDRILAIANRAYVLQNGRIVLQGTAAEVRRSEVVVAAYTGQRSRKGSAVVEGS
jgi:branched-chain amino acid transport system ATP-binding protein